MVNWDWNANPTYDSERVRIDATHSPLVVYDLRLPRKLEDDEVELMLSLAAHHLQGGLPFFAMVLQEKGTGVISAGHRHRFAEWLEAHREAMQRDDFGVIVVVPESIFRAVLRVVYRFRSPPVRTLTTRDLPGAADTARSELARIGFQIPPATEAFLGTLE